MNRLEISPDIQVAKLLDRWPQAISVFLSHRMACVGCGLSTFETLGEACRIYSLSVEEFIGEVNHGIQETQTKGL